MTARRTAVLGLALLALCGCERGKTRHLPPDPFAAPPPPAAPVPPPGTGASANLPKRPGLPGFFLDHVGQAVDPFNRQPAATAAGQPVLLDGFGFDPETKTPAKAIDVVVDGKAYGASYGAARSDVAAYFKAPALTNVGFRTVLPAGTLAPGAHSVIVRVVASDGKAYYDSPAAPFTVK